MACSGHRRGMRVAGATGVAGAMGVASVGASLGASLPVPDPPVGRASGLLT